MTEIWRYEDITPSAKYLLKIRDWKVKVMTGAYVLKTDRTLVDIWIAAKILFQLPEEIEH